MPRKRSSVLEVEMKEQRRRRLKAKRRLQGIMECPRCEREEVRLNIRRGEFTHTVQRNKYGMDMYVKCKIGSVFCKNCGLSVIAGLLPSEDLVDLYCWMYDKEVHRQRMERGLMYVLGEWP